MVEYYNCLTINSCWKQSSKKEKQTEMQQYLSQILLDWFQILHLFHHSNSNHFERKLKKNGTNNEDLCMSWDPTSRWIKKKYWTIMYNSIALVLFQCVLESLLNKDSLYKNDCNCVSNYLFFCFQIITLIFLKCLQFTN